ncbi:MAG: prepilin-type N-terminal cleavage/methylation domain-containing protein, partial [Phycisphaerales bacterium]
MVELLPRRAAALKPRQPPLNLNRSPRGFTLVELLVVVVIIAVLISA